MVMLTPELICDLRKALGLSAEAFGDLLGVAGNTVFQWESGRRHPKYDMQIKINKLIEQSKALQSA